MNARQEVKPAEVFSRAPITEAIFDVRVNLPDEFEVENFLKIHPILEKNYPQKTVLRHQQTTFEVSPGVAPTIESTDSPAGYIFKSKDGKKIVQVRRDGFTYNFLEPYKGWASFSREAKKLWKLYIEFTGSAEATRVALRYVNHIKIPLPVANLGDYFLTGLKLGEGIPGGVQEYFLRVVVPEPTTGNTAIITQRYAPILPSSKELDMILDIDVFSSGKFSVKQAGFLKKFDGLRAFKNLLFLRSISSKVKDLIR